MTPPTSELLDLVLSEFQHALREHLHYPWEAQYGTPPRYGYVEQTEWADNDLKRGRVIAAWHISPDAVHTSSIKDRESPQIDGMFFDLFQGWFCFTPDLAAVFIDWQTGPRFGRGFRHRIGRDTAGRYLLDRGAATSVS